MATDAKKQPDLAERLEELDDVFTVLMRCRDLDVPITPEMTQYVAEMVQEIEELLHQEVCQSDKVRDGTFGG